MKWILKAALQKVLSAFPNKEQYNYFFQWRMGNLPRSDEGFLEKIRLAHERLELFERFGPKREVGEIQCYEFGAGWDLIEPIAFYIFGVNAQTVIDLRPNVHLELVNDTLQKLDRHWEAIRTMTGRSLRHPGLQPLRTVSELSTRFGIRYLAPCDGTATGLASESIDFVSTNSTLEHIPPDVLTSILIDARRILKTDGVMAHFVDLKDHFAYFDSSISIYNFLTLPDAIWNLVNSALAYQNRLRYRDYHAIFQRAELRVVDEEIVKPNAEEVSLLRRLPLSRRFAGSDSVERLGIQIIRVVLAK